MSTHHRLARALALIRGIAADLAAMAEQLPTQEARAALAEEARRARSLARRLARHVQPAGEDGRRSRDAALQHAGHAEGGQPS